MTVITALFKRIQHILQTEQTNRTTKYKNIGQGIGEADLLSMYQAEYQMMAERQEALMLKLKGGDGLQWPNKEKCC